MQGIILVIHRNGDGVGVPLPFKNGLLVVMCRCVCGWVGGWVWVGVPVPVPVHVGVFLCVCVCLCVYMLLVDVPAAPGVGHPVCAAAQIRVVALAPAHNHEPQASNPLSGPICGHVARGRVPGRHVISAPWVGVGAVPVTSFCDTPTKSGVPGWVCGDGAGVPTGGDGGPRIHAPWSVPCRPGVIATNVSVTPLGGLPRTGRGAGVRITPPGGRQTGCKRRRLWGEGSHHNS